MLNNLIIYKVHLDLMEYAYKLLVKYPKYEKNGIVSEIKENLYDILKNIIYYNNKKTKISLNNILIDLNMLLVLIRISYKMKYITNKNYMAFARKINNISKLCHGLINSVNNQK